MMTVAYLLPLCTLLLKLRTWERFMGVFAPAPAKRLLDLGGPVKRLLDLGGPETTSAGSSPRSAGAGLCVRILPSPAAGTMAKVVVIR